jgi:hypothetical protein
MMRCKPPAGSPGGVQGRKSLPLHLQVNLYVPMGGGELDVAQPALSDGEVYTGLEQVHRC